MEEYRALLWVTFIILGIVFTVGNAKGLITAILYKNNSERKRLWIIAFEEEEYYRIGNLCRIVGVITDDKSVKKSNPPLYCVYRKMMHRKSEMK